MKRSHLRGDRRRALARLVEIAAVLDQLGPERAHRRVLFRRIAIRYDDGAGNAVAARGEGEALSMVAARRADDAGQSRLARRQLCEQIESAADLECAGRRVVLVLHPDVAARAARQQRPVRTAASAPSRRRRCWRRLRVRRVESRVRSNCRKEGLRLAAIRRRREFAVPVPGPRAVDGARRRGSSRPSWSHSAAAHSTVAGRRGGASGRRGWNAPRARGRESTFQSSGRPT